ncbi:MAG: tRNA 2-selenouridine(34) synthase MnmH [Bacteroidales bacterium]|nr:tRNA 2-selenouridine(34) synthase MnmH [Bacteroidales bacterium]MBN2697819.1 tRNA 2-selenouridine(34) synthase MnmH [Bacteroidales bacterium]
MIEIVDIEKFLDHSDQGIPVVDVRSPGEYQKAHIPGAINIPLFLDDERKRVGTAYKQVNREAALFAGLDIVGKKMVDLAKNGMKAGGRNKKLLMHCWRGGMRSESMAWLFDTMGLTCYVLKGGYKSYRTYLREFLKQPFQIIIIGGKTGSGKTEIIKRLYQEGEQVVDLEGLANHKGSAFGALGEQPQPSTEQFENFLFQEMRGLDAGKNIWMEDESRNIGRCVIPPELYLQMKESRTLFLDIPAEMRAQRLVRDYAAYEKEDLRSCILKIGKKLGGEKTGESLEMLEKNEFYQCILNILDYYDRSYMFSLHKNHEAFIEVPSRSMDPEHNMRLLLDRVVKKKLKT